jgi:hypothetical protein
MSDDRSLRGYLVGGGATVVVYDNIMGSAPGGGIAHRLARYSYPRLDLLDELVYGLPQCCIQDLVISASGRVVLTYLNCGQGKNGYELFSLDGPIRRLGIGPLFTLAPMWAAPVFSPSETVVACCSGAGAWWLPPEEQWPDDDREEREIPSTGGLATLATIVVHDLRTDVLTHHRLDTELSPGWVPDDPWDSRWDYGATDLRFPTENRLSVTLPGIGTLDLALPLPQVVRVPQPDPRWPPPR